MFLIISQFLYTIKVKLLSVFTYYKITIPYGYSISLESGILTSTPCFALAYSLLQFIKISNLLTPFFI